MTDVQGTNETEDFRKHRIPSTVIYRQVTYFVKDSCVANRKGTDKDVKRTGLVFRSGPVYDTVRPE